MTTDRTPAEREELPISLYRGSRRWEDRLESALIERDALAAQLAEQRSINAAQEAENAAQVAALRHIVGLGSSVPLGMDPESFCRLNMNEAIKTAAWALHPDPSKAAIEWRTQVEENGRRKVYDELAGILSIQPEDDGSIGVSIKAMPGHIGGGMSFEEACDAAEDAAEAWMEAWRTQVAKEAVAEALSVERIYAALDGVLPHMAFERYGQFYNDDPYFNVADYIERLAIEVRAALSPEQPDSEGAE